MNSKCPYLDHAKERQNLSVHNIEDEVGEDDDDDLM